MILDEWWVYAGIAAWAVVLDSATLLSASATLRFLLTPTGAVFLLIRAVAALVTGLIMPLLLTEDFKLEEFPAVVVFLAPLITVTALEFLLGAAGASGTSEQTNLVDLLAELRRTTVAEARRKENGAKQVTDLRTARALAAACDAAELNRMLLELLHNKMPTIGDARSRLGQLTIGMSQNDPLALRQELATELVKIDRQFAKTTLRDIRARQPASPP